MQRTVESGLTAATAALAASSSTVELDSVLFLSRPLQVKVQFVWSGLGQGFALTSAVSECSPWHFGI